MGAAELTRHTMSASRALARQILRERRERELPSALAAVWLLNVAGVAAGRIAPELAPGGGPQPTLHGSVGDVMAILATNLRLLSVPFVLALLGFHRSGPARAFGDLLVGAMVAVNCLRVGLAVGCYGTRLIPYIPQLPIEWLALALSASAWIAARHGARSRLRSLCTLAPQTFLAAAAAAAVEALLTPHAR